MKKRHLVLAMLSALGLVALIGAGGPAGTLVRLGPLEWSFASTPELVFPRAEALVQTEAPAEPLS